MSSLCPVFPPGLCICLLLIVRNKKGDHYEIDAVRDTLTALMHIMQAHTVAACFGSLRCRSLCVAAVCCCLLLLLCVQLIFFYLNEKLKFSQYITSCSSLNIMVYTEHIHTHTYTHTAAAAFMSHSMLMLLSLSLMRSAPTRSVCYSLLVAHAADRMLLCSRCRSRRRRL